MKPYWRITLGYIALGVGWIFLTDILGFFCAPDTHSMVIIQLFKGAFYVLISALLVFHLSKKVFREQARIQEERVKLLRAMVGSAYHILLNYLNQMQLVTLEAEKFSEFDPEILQLSHRISDQAAGELIKLGQFNEWPDSR